MKNLITSGSKLLICLMISIISFHSCKRNAQVIPNITFSDSACIKIIAEDSFDSLVVLTKFNSRFPFHDCTFRKVYVKKEGYYYLYFKLTKPELVEVTIIDAFFAYLIPGDTLAIKVGKTKELQGKSEVYYNLNNPIYQYFKNEKNVFGKLIFEKPYVNSFPTSRKELEKEFLATDSIRNKQIEFLDKNSTNLPKWFLTTQKLDYIYFAATAKYLLNFYFHDLNFKGEFPLCDVKLNNEEAKLSSYYYDFLLHYFPLTFLDEKHNNLVGSTRAIDLWNKASQEINSNLKGEILYYFNFGTIEGLYNAAFSRSEIDSVDKFRKSHEFGLNGNAEKYLDQARSNRLKVIEPQTNYKLIPGDLVKTFILKDSTGTDRKSSEFLGTFVCLHFWATWCKPCLNELPRVNDLCTTFKNEPVIIVNICLDDEKAKWMGVIRKEKLKGINLICKGNNGEILQKAYNIKGIPHYTILDKNGRLLINDAKRPPELYDELLKFIK